MNITIFQLIGHICRLTKRSKILEIIAQGKGVIPYEIVADMESFFIKPDKDFCEKTDFF